jgi:hypothetical protein
MVNDETNRAVRAVMAEVEKDMRARLGDEFVDACNRITQRRDDFKRNPTNAIENGKSGPAMAEFLNENAWLWKYLYEEVERDLPYRSGRVRSWIKVKNPASPAVLRIVEEGAW